MIDWLLNLPVLWMALVIFAATYLITGVIYYIIKSLAVGEPAKAFKSVSPGLLPPLGTIFGLFVAFVAVQVWNDVERAKTAVSTEASALRAVILLSDIFPQQSKTNLHALVHRYIIHTATLEWPIMARQFSTLKAHPPDLLAAQHVVLAMTPNGRGQEIAQGAMAAALERALDARRQRIIISQSSVNWVKCVGLLLQAACTLVAIAIVHHDHRLTAVLALALFATGVAISLIMIAAHAQPFTGQMSVGPQILLQAMPD